MKLEDKNKKERRTNRKAIGISGDRAQRERVLQRRQKPRFGGSDRVPGYTMVHQNLTNR